MLIPILTFLFYSVYATDYCKLCEDGSHTMCQFKEGPAKSCVNYTKILLSPGEKRYILDMHNDIRNHVASGQESRGAVGSQPPAADMFLLEWDNELAKIAQRWADQCISVNSTVQHDKCKKSERFEVGQNIMTAITKTTNKPELSLLILNWYKQIVSIVPSDIDNFPGIWRGEHLIGQYTQLVWANTKFIGCAAAAFKEAVSDPQYNIRFICNYGPTGNIIGQRVYEKGESCSKCPHKLCDKVRPNLCASIKKKVEQKNTIFKQIKEKDDPRHSIQLTTLSNTIENEDLMINTSKSFVPTLLNKADNLSKFDIKLVGPESFNFTSVTVPDILVVTTTLKNVDVNKDFEISSFVLAILTFVLLIDEKNSSRNGDSSTSTEKRNLITNSYTTSIDEDIGDDLSNYSYSTLFSEVTKKNISSTFITENNTSMSNFPNLQTFSIHQEEVGNPHDINSTTSLPTNWQNDTDWANSTEKVKAHEIDKGVNTPVNNSLIIDLTKDKCGEKIKLPNDAILAQACEKFRRRQMNTSNHFPRRFDTVVTEGDDLILPGNRRFRRVKGTWINGHCRCVQFLRSCSADLEVTQLLTFICILFRIIITN